MAKVQTKTYDNGATLLYQHTSKINGYRVCLGFSGGAQLDGQCPGLSHLIEHLLFRGLTDKKTNDLVSKIMSENISPNAGTSGYFINISFDTTKDCVKKFLDLFVKRLKNQTFTQEQIKKELDVITHEIELSTKKPGGFTNDELINSLQLNTPPQYEIDPLGDIKKLRKYATPKLVAEYMKNYFNSSNLVISLVTNDSFAECEKLALDSVISHFEPATKDEYIVQPPDPVFYVPHDAVILSPTPKTSGVGVLFYVRDRLLPVDNIEKECAYDTLESNMLCGIGSLFYHKFRTEEGLTYSSSLSSVETGTSRFKVFGFNTNKTHLRKMTKKFCETLNEISENGLDKSTFEAVKKALTKARKTKLLNFRAPWAEGNFIDYLSSQPFIDEELVFKHINNMTFEDFNEHVKSAYKKPNVSMMASGDFDTRICYTLAEINEMLGKKVTPEEKAYLNFSRVEHLPITLSPEEGEIWKSILSYYGKKVNTHAVEEEPSADDTCDDEYDDEEEDE